MGRPFMEKSPSSTMTIEITDDRMGRRMKRFFGM